MIAAGGPFVLSASPALRTDLAKGGSEVLTHPAETNKTQAMSPSSTGVVALLSASTLFGMLDEAPLRDLEAELQPVRLSGGEALFRQGDPGDCLYIVTHGRLRVSIARGDAEHVVGEVSRGESVGEMALLTGESRSATVRAIRDTELLRLSQAGFDRLVEKHPQTMRQLARLIVQRLRQTIQVERAVNTLATVAVVPAGPDVPLSDFACRLAAALATIGPTLHLSSRRCDRVLGAGAAQASPGEAGDSTLVSWLNEQETKYQFVIYEADPTPSPWTGRCSRQADRCLVVGCAEAEPQRGEIGAELLRLNPHETPVHRELVLLHRSLSSQLSRTREWRGMWNVDTHHHVRLPSTADFARLARLLTGRAVGLVLGGGGARGFAHIGVIRALKEAGIPIDLIGGTSMGAVIAAQYALGWDHEAMLSLNRKGWIESRPLTDYTLPVTSLITGRKVLAMLAMMFGDTRIEDLWLPYFCVSSNLTLAEVMVHREGALKKWVAASIAVPGIGPPLCDQGNLLVDGGVLNNLPADVMRTLSAGPVIAVDVNLRLGLATSPLSPDDLSAWQLLLGRLSPFAQKYSAPGIFDILLRTATLNSVRSAEHTKRQVALYIRPAVEQVGTFEWKALDHIVEIGYRSAQQQIAAWHL
jgi:NTE family protein/lysophospholipid hydrolase